MKRFAFYALLTTCAAVGLLLVINPTISTATVPACVGRDTEQTTEYTSFIRGETIEDARMMYAPLDCAFGGAISGEMTIIQRLL